MKNILAFLALNLFLGSYSAVAQTNGDEISAGETGQIVLPDNSSITGTILNNIRKKGEVILYSGGKKKKYKAGDLASVQIGSARFVTINYTFYEIIWEGKTISLLRKANEPADVQYNGNDAIIITSEGKTDDLFIRKSGPGTLEHLTKKNVNEVLKTYCPSHSPAEVATVDASWVKQVLSACGL